MSIPFKVVARDGVPFAVHLTGAELLAPIVAAAATSAAAAEAAREDLVVKAEWGQVQVDRVAYDAIDFAVSTTVASVVIRNDVEGFSCFGQSYTTPDTIEFNAVFIPRISRQAASTDKWETIEVIVKTSDTNPSLLGATKVARGSVAVNPNLSPLNYVLVPLYDMAGDPFAVTEADLDSKFAVAFQAKNAGGNATASECWGTVDGATKLTSYYLTGGDLEDNNWTAYSGNPTLCIGLALLDNIDQIPEYPATENARNALGLVPDPQILLNPRPSDIIMTPRWFGMTLYPGSIYNAGLTTGQRAKVFDFSGNVGLGRHQTDRWYWDPALGIEAAPNNLTIMSKDPEHLGEYDRQQVAVYAKLANYALGQTRNLICIGDSTTAAGIYTQRLLDRQTANANGAQLTLLGTLGTGSNKHEGRSGWKIANYFQDATAGAYSNPFIENDGDKFNASFYLSDTGVATPDITHWHLSINDVFGFDSDADVNTLMSTALDMLEKMIGVTPDSAVGSWKEANASIKTLIATPIIPASSQTGFGGGTYYIGQTQARYKRNIGLAAQRIIERFGGAESDGIFLVPWHTSINPVASFTGDVDPIHPNAAGYNEMGDELYYAVNYLSGAGLI